MPPLGRGGQIGRGEAFVARSRAEDSTCLTVSADDEPSNRGWPTFVVGAFRRAAVSAYDVQLAPRGERRGEAIGADSRPSSAWSWRCRNLERLAFLHANVSSYARLRRDWLFDCGEATQHQLMRSNLRYSKITRVFITHMHGDHIFGLPGLICALSGASAEKRRVHGKDPDPLYITGPPGICEFVKAAISCSRTVLGLPLVVTELAPARRRGAAPRRRDDPRAVAAQSTSPPTRAIRCSSASAGRTTWRAHRTSGPRGLGARLGRLADALLWTCTARN